MIIQYHRQFKRDLIKLKDRKTKTTIISLIELLKSTDEIHSIPNIKKLKEYTNAYRAKIGIYRIGIYKFDDTLLLARLKKRNDIYKLFP
jgi:mRNA interferase RelE/StbE